MATTEVNFLDLAALLKVTDDTAFEKFSSVLNSSIFDASNIAGSLKQKGLIDFTSYYPGPNKIILTDTGKALIAEADSRSTEPLDKLDETLLHQLAGGKRMPAELQDTLNVRPKDLALRLYKLLKQNLITYEFKNGNVEMILTEQGFLQAKSEQSMQPKPGKPAVPTAPGAPAVQAQPNQQQQTPQTATPAPMTQSQVQATIQSMKQEEKEREKEMLSKEKGAKSATTGKGNGRIKVVLVIALLIVLGIILLYSKGYILLP